MVTHPKVVAVSKPASIPALRATWRKSAEHKAAQAWRFLRLYVFTFIGQVVMQVIATAITGGVDVTHLDQKALAALLIPAAEVVWRQKHPSLTAGAVDSAPGVTIVPDQVLPNDPGVDAGLSPDAGETLLGLLGAILLVIGVVLVIVGAVHHPAYLSVSGLILAGVGLVISYYGGDLRTRR